MSHPEPESPAPQVPVVDQFIVGFGETTFVGGAEAAVRRVDIALATLLESLPATLLRKYVATSEKEAYFAIAVIRLDGPQRTLADLQKEVESGKEENKPGYAHIAWTERNAPMASSIATASRRPGNNPIGTHMRFGRQYPSSHTPRPAYRAVIGPAPNRGRIEAYAPTARNPYASPSKT